MVVSCARMAGKVIGIAMLMASGSTVFAQTGTMYTLADLADSARHHLPLLLEKQALINSAKAGITEARHAFLPKLNVVDEVSVGTANDLTGGFLPIPGVFHGISGGVTAANNYQAATSNLASLYGEYELVNFGLRGAKVENAKAFAGVQEADFDRQFYMVKWQIGKIYFGILQNRSQLAVEAENVRRFESVYGISRALTGTGINAGVDSSLAKAGLSGAKVGYNQQLARLRKLEQELSYLTGIVSPKIGMDVTERKIAADRFLAYAEDTLHNPLSDYYNKQALQFRSEAALIRKSYLPKIILGAGGWARGSSIQYSNDYKSLEEGLGLQRLNYTAGLGVTYDLFNGVRRKDKLAVAGYQQDAADYTLQQAHLSLHNDAVQAGEDIDAAQKNLAELPVQVQAATDAFKQSLAQYESGLINLVDLTNASFVLYKAQSDYITTEHEWYLACLNRAAATGTMDQFIQTVK
jgi:outer membrane protein